MSTVDVTTHANSAAVNGTQQTEAQQDAEVANMSPETRQLKIDVKQQLLKKLYESQKEDNAQTRNMQRFMSGKDTTGSDDGDEVHGNMSKAAGKMGLPPISKSHVKNVHARVGSHPAFQETTHQVKLALQGQGSLPTAHQIAGAASKAFGDTGGITQPTGAAPEAATQSRAKAGASEGDSSAAQESSTSTAAQTPGASASNSGGESGSEGQSNPSTQSTASSLDLSNQTTLLAGEGKSALSQKEIDKTNEQIANIISGKADVNSVAGNVMGFVYAVMMQAQTDGNKDKREILNHTKMLNGMQKGLSDFVSNTLMPAQDELSRKISSLSDKDKSGGKASNMTVTVQGVPQNMNTETAPTNADTGQIVPEFQYSAKDGGRKQMTQTDLTNTIQNTQQWQTSIQNNQQTQTNRFQAVDSNQTSSMNIINSLLKNTNDAKNAILRNVQT